LQTFTTKLSIPKSISVAHSLNFHQRNLVKSIGFHHLLDLGCTSTPKSLIMWVANHFNVVTRTFIFPNGYKFTLCSENIHQVFGIPLGGSSIPNICTEDIKQMILEEKKCSSKYPSSNELKDLITADFVGDKFKNIFTLFAVSTFLCPTTSDLASRQYFP